MKSGNRKHAVFVEHSSHCHSSGWSTESRVHLYPSPLSFPFWALCEWLIPGSVGRRLKSESRFVTLLTLLVPVDPPESPTVNAIVLKSRGIR